MRPLALWDEAAIERLTDLAARGHGCTTIARMMGPGYPKNAVIGQMSRLRLFGRRLCRECRRQPPVKCGRRCAECSAARERSLPENIKRRRRRELHEYRAATLKLCPQCGVEKPLAEYSLSATLEKNWRCSACCATGKFRPNRAARAAKKWTAERLAEVQEHLDAGESYAVLAASIRETKGAAIGAAWRAGLCAPRPQKYEPPVPEGCRWIGGDVRVPGWSWCGAEPVDHTWCAEHRRRVYIIAPRLTMSRLPR